MSTLLAYYSYSGNTKNFAEEAAKKEGAQLCEIKEVKRLPAIGTFFVGCPQAVSGKARPIQPLGVNLGDFDKIILMAPIWAGNPAPALNGVIALLPSGKEVELRMVSGGGTSNKEKVTARVEAKGCKVVGYRDIESGN